jgi:hypothetical protein
MGQHQIASQSGYRTTNPSRLIVGFEPGVSFLYYNNIEKQILVHIASSHTESSKTNSLTDESIYINNILRTKR